MAQGFVKALNLFESQDGDSAKGVLNNLAGAGIATDIALFANNLRTFNFVNYTNFVASANAYPVNNEEFYDNVNPELNTNGTFLTDTEWLKYNPNLDLISEQLGGGRLDISVSSQSAGDIENGFAVYQHLDVTPGQEYSIQINRILLEEPVNGVGTATVKIFDAPGFSNLNTDEAVGVGFNTFDFTPTASTVTFAIHVVGGDASFDDVSTKLKITLDPADFDYLVIPRTEVGVVPLANGTEIYQIDDDGNNRIFYKVVDSNALDRFRLKKIIDGVVQPTVATFDHFYEKVNKTFYIDLPVTFENMTSFSVTREELNDGSGGTGESTGGDGGGTDQTGEDSESSILAPPTNLTFLKTNDLGTLQGEIDSAVDTFYYKESRTIVSYKDNYFNRLIELNGVMYIANDSDVQYNDANKNTMPGLFIVSHGEAVRAFSDTNNPWDTNLTLPITDYQGSSLSIPAITTVEDTESASVLNLIFEGPNPALYTTEPANIKTVSGADINVQENFTHKMPVTINGQPFFLLLTDTDPSTI